MAHGRARRQMVVEAGCQGPRAREVAIAVEAGSRRWEAVDGGESRAEPSR